jgi:hypothetical protein
MEATKWTDYVDCGANGLCLVGKLDAGDSLGKKATSEGFSLDWDAQLLPKSMSPMQEGGGENQLKVLG